MRFSRQFHLPPTLGLALVLAAGCADETDPVSPQVTAAPTVAEFTLLGQQPAHGAVYLMSNADGPNEVLVFERSRTGTLTPAQPVATGGTGTGAGLGNQGALTLTRDGRWLLVVNPGSDDVSVFRVTPDGLELSDRAPSGGTTPISVTVHGDVVYVLHAGMPNSISGLRLANDGTLHPIPGSTRSLSGDMVGPAQIGFAPDGDALIVTEKATNQLTTFRVGLDGVASPGQSQASAGQTPFGFAFNDRGILVVSEASGGAEDASTASSYRVASDASLELLEGAQALTETAACWVAIPENGRFAYTTNTGSGSVTGLGIGARGGLELLDEDGETGLTGDGSRPIDAAFSRGGRYLYVLSAGTSRVNVFATDGHGALEAVGDVSVPETANGLAAM